MQTADYEISDEAWQKCADVQHLSEIYAEGKTMQDVVGYTDEMMLELYDVAVDLSKQKHHDDSIAAFVFLTTINPKVAAFWIGKGVSHIHAHQNAEAEMAFLKALDVHPSDVNGYLFAIKFYLDQNNKAQAEEVLEGGLKKAQESDDPEQWKEFNEISGHLKAVIQEA